MLSACGGSSGNATQRTGSSVVGAACDTSESLVSPKVQNPPSVRGDQILPSFREVAKASGIDYCQGKRRNAPDCLLNTTSVREKFPKFATNPALFDGGEACESERQTGGAAVGDYDDDGWPDVYVTRLDGPGLLFRNQRDGNFRDVTRDAGLMSVSDATNGAGFADLDNDGDADLVVTTIASDRVYYFVNDGAGRFDEQGAERGLSGNGTTPNVSQSVNFGDYDNDGYLDAHITEWRKFPLPAPHRSAARLFRNRGREDPGKFEDVTVNAGVEMSVGGSSDWSFSSALRDLDGDGFADLIVASDFGTSRLFWNDGRGGFVDGTEALKFGDDVDAMGLAIIDVDGDQLLDIFVSGILDPPSDCANGNCNNGRSGNRLYRNRGDRRFEDATDRFGVRDGKWGWGTAFFDPTNSGRFDLIQASGMDLPYVVSGEWKGGPTLFWAAAGKGLFQERAADVGLVERGTGKALVVFDYDRDGKQDVLIVRDGKGPSLFHNATKGTGHWLEVKLIGRQSNRDGVGAVVRIVRNGTTISTMEYGSITHYLGSSENIAHFGIGPDASGTFEVQVFWPASGTSSSRVVRSLDTRIEIRESP